MTTEAQRASAFSCARQVAQVIDMVVGSQIPRVLVIGTARSGKSTLLREISRMLADLDIGVTEYRRGVGISAVATSDVLVIDDLQELSPEQLAEVAARCLNPEASLIAASRPWPRPDALTAIWRQLQREAPPVVLGVVSRADALASLEARGRAIDDACLAQILTMTGGISWLVLRALILHDPRDCDSDQDHAPLRRLLEDEIAQQLSTTDERLRRLVELVSFDAPATVLLDEPRSNSTIDALITQGHAEGLLLRNGETVPIVRAAVLAATPAHRLAKLKAQVTGSDDPRPDEGHPSGWLQQAADAWASGDPDLAAGFVERAELAGDHPDSDAATDLRAAIWAERDMSVISSDSYLARPPSSIESQIRATVAHIGAGLADRLQTNRPGQLAPTTLGVALQLFDSGLRHSLDRQPPPTTLGTLVQASELYTASRTTDPIAELPAIVAAAVAIGSGDLSTAKSVIDAAIDGGQGGSLARPRLLGWRADLAIRSEQPQQARDALAEADELVPARSTRTRLFLETVRITLARRFDDIHNLEAAWAGARTLARSAHSSLYSLLALGSLIDAGARLGESQTLAPYLTKGLEITRQLGDPPLWASHLWWAGIQQGILLNKPASLAPYAQALVAAAPHSPVAAAMAQAGAAWMAVLGGRIDVDAVEEAAGGLAAAGLPWDGARLAAHGAGRLPDDRKAAARLMARARELHPPDVTRQTTVKSQPKPAPAHRGVQLSDREHDVAVLVLAGKTYAEIGEAIYISPRTVEHHVASIRRRLDAASRSDLIAKLRLTIGSDGATP